MSDSVRSDSVGSDSVTSAPTAEPSEQTPPAAPSAPTPGAVRSARYSPKRVGSRPAAAWLLGAAAVAALLAGVVLRFVAHTHLWLDEAQSVAIARRPLSGLFAALRQDGSPPLYYLLLHYWMGWFGTGDNIAVRALSGVISVATLPPFYLLARRTIGRRAAVAAVLLLASSPFALRYATETRMYALVGLLTTLAGLVLTRVLDDDRRTAWSVLALTTSCGLLLLTHYWGLYGVAALGLWQLTAALRHRQRRHWFALGAAAASGLFLVPWLPSFRYQLQHTGTPWGGGASLADFINTIFGWAGRGDAAGRVLTLAVLALLLLGVCGRAGADRQIVLDLRGQRPGRGLAGLFLGILALPIAAGILANQAFSLRYTMVAFVPFLLVLAVGIQCFAAPARRHGVLALVVVLGLLNGLAQTHDSRTQAGRFAKLLAAQAEPGDVVAFCPDQLGPAVHRLLPGFGDQVVFPIMGSAERVDWVDYGQRNQSASVPTFADELNRRAAGHQVWLIWAAGYKTATPQCRTLQASLTELRPRHQVVLDPNNSFERAQLVDFQP